MGLVSSKQKRTPKVLDRPACPPDKIYATPHPSSSKTRVAPEEPPENIAGPSQFNGAALRQTIESLGDEAGPAYQAFLKDFPEYQQTWMIDVIREKDFSRLTRSKELYVDHCGGGLYPESLVRSHAEFMTSSVFGNTHSESNTSQLSHSCMEEARQTVLSFFHAPSSEYAVVFTPNATGAMRLIGESFPFGPDSAYVLGVDSHNSVHGIRQFAESHNAKTVYIPSTKTGGFEQSQCQQLLEENKPNSDKTSSLFLMTGLSNISNTKPSWSMINYAASLGYHTMVDAAALAATSPISLQQTPVDAIAISFYKMFGYPTGIGALVIKKSFLQVLRRPWFAGGTVSLVQVPGTIITRSTVLHEQFEDGTLNYLALPAVAEGIRFLSACMPFLPTRISCLMHYVCSSLSQLKHEETGTPIIQILSQQPHKRVKSLGEQADCAGILSFLLMFSSGELMPLAFIEHIAQQQNVSLRTGCMCNPGGATLLGVEHAMDMVRPGMTMDQVAREAGRDLGLVRISFGLSSSFHDAWRVVQFISLFGKKDLISKWDSWNQSSREH